MEYKKTSKQIKTIGSEKIIEDLNRTVVLIQETKQEAIDFNLIKALWSSKDIGWEFIEAVGRSEDILTM